MSVIAPDNAHVLAPEAGRRKSRIVMGGGEALACVVASPAQETGNEDVAAVIPVDDHAAVIAVADGCGGHAAGAQAALGAIEALVRCVQTKASADGLGGRIVEGFDAANAAVARMGVGAACTLAVVEIAGSVARPYHVGDSEVLIVGQRGRRKLQTISHSPVGYAVEAGLLGEGEAIHHEERHIVSNHVGSPDMRIDIGPPVELAARDTVLVASDGLFDNLHTDEVVSIIRAGSLELAAGELSRWARERMVSPKKGEPSKPDDLGFVLFRMVPGRER